MRVNRIGLLSAACAVVLLAGVLVASVASAAARTCALCTTWVTTFDPDGSAGPAAPFTRVQSNLLVDVSYAIDVTGNLPPVPLGLVPLPGYELSVTVKAIDAAKPTVLIKRLGVVPVTLPLRIELLTGDLTSAQAVKQSVGYDTLSSSAPLNFKAVIDLSDRDGNPTTTQALAAVSISGASKSLTLLEQNFTGDPLGVRVDGGTRRLTFSGDGVKTHVPSTIGLDLTSSKLVTHAVLTHDLQTDLAYEVTQPGGLPRTTGNLAPLPAKIDLTLTDVDVNGDGVLDNQVDYIASAPTPAAVVTIQTAAQTTDVHLTDLPSQFHLTAAITDTTIDVTYHASASATAATITSANSSKKFTVQVAGVPANIDQLTSVTTPDGGSMVYRADSRASSVTLTADIGAKHASAVITGVPSSVTVDYSSTATEGHYHYSTSGDLIPHATLTYADAQHQHFVVEADQIPSVLNVDYVTKHVDSPALPTEDDLNLTYHASSRIPHAELHATNLAGLIDRARNLDVTLDGVPTDFALAMTNQHYRWPYIGTISNVSHDFTVSATTGGGDLTHGTFLATSGPDDELPTTSDTGAPVDGVMYRDLSDRFVISGRISQFNSLKAEQYSLQHVAPAPDGTDQLFQGQRVDKLHAELKTDAPSHFLELVLDKQAQVPPTSTTGNQTGSPPPVDETVARLAGLPTDLSLDSNSDGINGHNSTVWKASGTVSGYQVPGSYQAGFELTHGSVDQYGTATLDTDARIDPMPKNFTACQSSSDDSCSAPIFNDNLQAAHTGPTQQQYDAACNRYGKPDCDNPVPWYFRSFACFGVESCGNWAFDAQPGNANQGSVLLQADQAISLSYGTGDYLKAADPFTLISFTNLTRFALQAHNSGAYDCGSDTGFCQWGTIDLDTDGHAVSGEIKTKSASSSVEMVFPQGFTAGALIWDFKQTGGYSGRHATRGALTCPSGTILYVGGTNRAGQICNGDLQA